MARHERRETADLMALDKNYGIPESRRCWDSASAFNKRFHLDTGRVKRGEEPEALTRSSPVSGESLARPSNLYTTGQSRESWCA